MATETKSLATLVKDHNALVELIIESGGELNETLEEWLKVDEKSIASKVDGYKFAMDDLASRSEFLKARADVFRQAATTIENVIDRVKSNLKYQMMAMEADEVLGNEFRFKLSKPTGRLSIENKDVIPPSFTDEEIVFIPNKEKIKAALDAGETVPGCKIEFSQSLRAYPNTGASKPKKQVEGKK